VENVKIDVCVVTKNNKKPRGLENVPINNVIIETSKPLGLARMKAIQKVETPNFAFVDDDVIIGENWFKTVFSSMNDKVGAVHGNTVNVGLGHWITNGFRKHNVTKYRTLKLGQRGFTTCTLIKTSLVKDWVPSTKDLSSYEDYEITQHILNKGHKWLSIPTDSLHKTDWKHISKSAVWGSEGWLKVCNPSKKEILIFILKKILAPFKFITYEYNMPIFVFQLYQNLYSIIGVIQELLKGVLNGI
jgi:hypothetical protein